METRQENTNEPAASAKRRSWVVESVLIIVFILLLAGVAMQGQTQRREKLMVVEVCNGLHEIQLAAERFAVDTGGTYPDYLYGGEGKYSAPTEEDGKVVFGDISECAGRTKLHDPLLRKGYLIAYPVNPFARDGALVHQTQVRFGDPLRNGTEEAELHGTRFGAKCNLMGNVLADYRYAGFHHADFGYPFFDLWPEGAKKPKFYLPGQFFYKSAGVIVVASKETGEEYSKRPILPTVVEYYVLGAYGSPTFKGLDVLGPETDILFGPFDESTGHHTDYTVPSWTRSTMTEKDAQGRYLGSPFGRADDDRVDRPSTGNPNGIPDGVVLVLTPGEDPPRPNPPPIPVDTTQLPGGFKTTIESWREGH